MATDAALPIAASPNANVPAWRVVSTSDDPNPDERRSALSSETVTSSVASAALRCACS
ncbi:hypothetical protein [Amycolatopsis minnesotensis]|uniref:hypothetical protein n=1 Tax=Amycolatopsis minnesotensis TaxID=337894 RepID=UPI0031D5DB73